MTAAPAAGARSPAAVSPSSQSQLRVKSGKMCDCKQFEPHVCDCSELSRSTVDTVASSGAESATPLQNATAVSRSQRRGKPARPNDRESSESPVCDGSDLSRITVETVASSVAESVTPPPVATAHSDSQRRSKPGWWEDYGGLESQMCCCSDLSRITVDTIASSDTECVRPPQGTTANSTSQRRRKPDKTDVCGSVESEMYDDSDLSRITVSTVSSSSRESTQTPRVATSVSKSERRGEPEDYRSSESQECDCSDLSRTTVGTIGSSGAEGIQAQKVTAADSKSQRRDKPGKTGERRSSESQVCEESELSWITVRTVASGSRESTRSVMVVTVDPNSPARGQPGKLCNFCRKVQGRRCHCRGPSPATSSTVTIISSAGPSSSLLSTSTLASSLAPQEPDSDLEERGSRPSPTPAPVSVSRPCSGLRLPEPEGDREERETTPIPPSRPSPTPTSLSVSRISSGPSLTEPQGDREEREPTPIPPDSLLVTHNPTGKSVLIQCYKGPPVPPKPLQHRGSGAAALDRPVVDVHDVKPARETLVKEMPLKGTPVKETPPVKSASVEVVAETVHEESTPKPVYRERVRKKAKPKPVEPEPEPWEPEPEVEPEPEPKPKLSPLEMNPLFFKRPGETSFTRTPKRSEEQLPPRPSTRLAAPSRSPPISATQDGIEALYFDPVHQELVHVKRLNPDPVPVRTRSSILKPKPSKRREHRPRSADGKYSCIGDDPERDLVYQYFRELAFILCLLTFLGLLFHIRPHIFVGVVLVVHLCLFFSRKYIFVRK